MSRNMKTVTIGLLILLGILLLALGLNKKSFLRNLLIPTKGVVVTLEKTEVKKVANTEWEEIKSSKKLLQCYQSKKDFDQKRIVLLPKYKEVLSREISSAKLNIEDQYIKYIYSGFEASGKYYGYFENIVNTKVPSSEEEITKIKNLLEFVYCPDVSKIPVTYPLTPDGCKELLLTWGARFEVPEPRNYQIIEEYNLALEKFKLSQKSEIESANKCCYGGDRGASCAKLWYYLE